MKNRHTVVIRNDGQYACFVLNMIFQITLRMQFKISCAILRNIEITTQSIPVSILREFTHCLC